jgi:K+ transporter
VGLAPSGLLAGGGSGFLVLGGVFLCVTGAEALYADMGHFGAGPIRLAWSAVVFPSLVLNYAGQAALVLEGAPSSDNIFYRLCPSFLMAPAGIDGGDEAVHMASRPKSSSQVTLCWREMDSNLRFRTKSAPLSETADPSPMTV